MEEKIWLATRAARHGDGNGAVRFREENAKDMGDVSELNRAVPDRVRRSCRRLNNKFLGSGITTVSKSNSRFLLTRRWVFLASQKYTIVQVGFKNFSFLKL